MPVACTPGGIYTGAIGTIAPSGECQFNVAIRTAVLSGGAPGGRAAGDALAFELRQKPALLAVVGDDRERQPAERDERHRVGRDDEAGMGSETKHLRVLV